MFVKCRAKVLFFTVGIFYPHDIFTGQTMSPTDICYCYGNNTYPSVAKAVAV